jgi:hypothetical protein
VTYIDDHPTNFNWAPAVAQRVREVQAHHPWQTYINTYLDHPPHFQVPRRWPFGYYSSHSFDVWGRGGHSKETYSGYRGKTLPKDIGDKIWHAIFFADHGPSIDWIIWQGSMWWNPTTVSRPTQETRQLSPLVNCSQEQLQWTRGAFHNQLNKRWFAPVHIEGELLAG